MTSPRTMATSSTAAPRYVRAHRPRPVGLMAVRRSRMSVRQVIAPRDLPGPLARGTSVVAGCYASGAELDVDRGRRVDQEALLEPAVRRVDAKDSDGVGVLIAHVEERPRRVDVHAA